MKVDPTTITQSIYDPCNVAILSAQSMTSDSTGEYFYNYAISSAATYGRYPVEVTATSATGNITIIKDEFFVLSWDGSRDVRQLTGIGDTKTISDTDMENMVWMSYQEALRDVYMHHYRERPRGNPDTGAGFDGSNTAFQTRNFPIADSNGDGDVYGYGQQSCGTDISGWWINNAGSYGKCWVTVSQKENGEISIFQNDGSSAIPSDNEGCYIDYWSSYNSYDETLFHQAVNYLTAHNVMLRLKEVDRVTLGDISRNAPIIEKDSNRFYKKYKMLLKKVCKPKFGGK